MKKLKITDTVKPDCSFYLDYNIFINKWQGSGLSSLFNTKEHDGITSMGDL